ncbi:hypothetical protein QIG53_27185, partial [Klebsiella pneumoniae]|nr:hypothetical protein [Klebsiella pneumoniae]
EFFLMVFFCGLPLCLCIRMVLYYAMSI